MKKQVKSEAISNIRSPEMGNGTKAGTLEFGELKSFRSNGNVEDEYQCLLDQVASAKKALIQSNEKIRCLQDLLQKKGAELTEVKQECENFRGTLQHMEDLTCFLTREDLITLSRVPFLSTQILRCLRALRIVREDGVWELVKACGRFVKDPFARVRELQGAENSCRPSKNANEKSNQDFCPSGGYDVLYKQLSRSSCHPLASESLREVIKKCPPPRCLSSKELPTVTFYINNLSSGGAERQLVTMARKMHRRGRRVQVIVNRLNGVYGHYASLLQEENVPLLCLSELPQETAFRFMEQSLCARDLASMLQFDVHKEVMLLASVLTERPTDILHSYLDWGNVVAGLAGLLSGIHAIRLSGRNVNPSHFDYLSNDWFCPAYQGLISQYPRVMLECNSRGGVVDYARWVGVPSERVLYMPNSIDSSMYASSPDAKQLVRARLGIPSDAPILLTVCRISPEKRPLDISRVFAEVAKRNPTCHLVHLGTGCMEDEFRADLQLRCPYGQVHLQGRRSDVADFMAAADVFLLTSVKEGMPNVVMEAMLLEVPIVSSNVGAVPDLMHNGKHGQTFPPGEISQMAQAVNRLLESPEKRKKMALAAKKRIKR